MAFGLVLAKDTGRAFLQPRLPVGDLVGVDIELLGQLVFGAKASE
ncbi:MAG: hypothetical protein ACYCPO_09355 [Acidobacteriaceae bacterium]